MKLSKLYKKTKTGAIEEWEISWGDGFYTITHGQVDGAMQSKTNKVKGKNVGRSNETTPLQQAESEALSRWKKQLDKGYSQNINKLDFVIPKPMLAHKFEDHSDKIEYPCYIQPKLDGVRCLAYLQNNKIVLLSRQGKQYNIPIVQEELFNLLSTMSNPPILDGELYIHGVDFQKLISWIKKEQPDTSNIQYHVYDCVTNKPFKDRWNEYFLALFGPRIQVKPVQTEQCKNKQEILGYHSKFISDGYEGSIIRYGNQSYESGYRSRYLLKLKDFITEEFEVVDAEEDKNNPGQCTFVLRTQSGSIFKAKPEGDTQYRQELWQNYQDYIGQMATVRFFEWTTSDESVPRFPVLVGFRDYE